MKWTRRFRFQVVGRILAIALNLLLLAYLILKSDLYATYLIVGAAVVYQIYRLIYYIEKSNRNLIRFLEAIRYADFSQSFSDSRTGEDFRELNDALSGIFRDFQRYRTEKEEQYRYLQTVVRHVGIGLLVFLPDGSVDLTNRAAKRLLQFRRLNSIDSLKAISAELVNSMYGLKPGDKALVKIDRPGEPLQLAIHATEFRMRGEIFKLVSLQNIRSELEEREMEAWQKMIRILTHEIMNSITPISSLTATVKDLVGTLGTGASGTRSRPADAEIMIDITAALKTIQKRSQGLQHFVSAYRNLTLIPKPKFEIFSIREMFGRIEKLMQSKMSKSSIRFIADVDPESLELTADPELVEQVLINLLNNAIDAVNRSSRPAIEMKARIGANGNPQIQIIDNGSGIIKEAREKLFVPFFTTKKKGSGIGLSLSRQIMRLHNGTIRVESESGQGSTFYLHF
jgi:nitrogen fixation/metabolism regulation signal transduction histidine kinase